jgi:D-psicose/D-tagatose/L-ribulose 3-epimerase
MGITRRQAVAMTAGAPLLASAVNSRGDGHKTDGDTMRVRLGMNMLLWGVDINSRHIPIFQSLSEAGFDGVEIPVIGQPESEINAMRAALDELGLGCTTATFVTPDINPIDPDPQVRAIAVDALKLRIDQTAALGSDLLIGGIYQAHKYFTGKGPTETEWGWSAEYLRAVGEYAAGKGIRLGLEFLNRFEVFLINTAADAARMCADVGLDNVGVLYDTHHANIEDPDPASALSILGDKLFHVHLSESHRGTLGTGQVKWNDTFAALKKMNYQGWLTIEAFGTSDAAIVSAANVWREAFDSPEQLYKDGIEFIRHNIS